MDDFWKSAVGAIVGFSLAQVVNLAKLTYSLWKAPKLKIIVSDDARLLSHSEQNETGEYVGTDYYGFTVQNTGRTPAFNLQCQLLKIEIIEKNGTEFEVVSEQTSSIKTFVGSYRPNGGSISATLLPGGSIYFLLASTDESQWAIYPSVENSLDYYEEICTRAKVYRFTVGTFAENANYKKEVILIAC